jgi:hypothetical protein
MEECAEKGCRYPATEELDGKKFCYNHWEINKDKKACENPPECSEPGCRYPACMNFHGKKLCKDCWERYKDEEDRRDMELRSL